jgi:hypothetical protein
MNLTVDDRWFNIRWLVFWEMDNIKSIRKRVLEYVYIRDYKTNQERQQRSVYQLSRTYSKVVSRKVDKDN